MKTRQQLQAMYGRIITTGAWRVRMMEDIEIYEGSMIPHSPFGDRFRHEASESEKEAFVKEYARIWEEHA